MSDSGSWTVQDIMLSVGGALRSGLLQLPVRGLRSSVRSPKTAGLSWSAAVCLCRPPVRTLASGSGPGADPGNPSWYGGLVDSAPVHLCQQVLVNVQEATGLPWWLNIVIATLSVRTVITLPLAAYQLIVISKVGCDPEPRFSWIQFFLRSSK